MCHWSHLLPRSLQIQRQQSPQDRLVVGVERILPPTVGGPDGAVEGLVGLVEPSGAGVVEVGQGAFFEFGFGCAVGACPERSRGIEPVLAQLVQPLRRRRDGLTLLVSWPGKGEGLKGL